MMSGKIGIVINITIILLSAYFLKWKIESVIIGSIVIVGFEIIDEIQKLKK